MTKRVISNTLLVVLVLFPLALVSGQSRPGVNAVEKEPQDAMSLILAARGLAEKGKDLDRALAYVKRAMSLPAIPNDAVPRDTFFLTLALVCIQIGYPHPIEQRRTEIRQALDQTGFTIPILIDPDYGVAKRFRETEKSIVLIDEKGIIRFRLSLVH